MGIAATLLPENEFLQKSIEEITSILLENYHPSFCSVILALLKGTNHCLGSLLTLMSQNGKIL